MKNLKRMSFNALQNEFPAMGKTEQALYVGEAKYTWKNGKWEVDENFLSSINLDAICVFGKVGQIVTTGGQGYGLVYGQYTSSGSTRAFFEFMANNTNVEWSMSIRNDGTAKVHTDNLANQVSQFTDNAKQVIHSHTISYGSELSQEDKDNAKANSSVTHTLYYNGQYRNFSQYGFYGSWYMN